MSGGAEAPTKVVILGSTGSVGTQALDVIRSHRRDYEVLALVAGRNTAMLEAQAAEFGVPPERARSGLDDPAALADLAALPEADVVLNAVVGFAGLPATIATLQAGTRLALANKESLIAGGPVVNAARDSRGRRDRAGRLGALRALPGAACRDDRRGPARAAHRERRAVPRAHARRARARRRSRTRSKHPTWDMGAKITIDSSTLMNKGLEVIEAHELFGIDYDRVDVVVHPQSVIHGMVEFRDGATMAQLSMPDMRLPIGLALGAPARLDEPFGEIDWTTLGSLTFETPDLEAFPCLALAYEAGRAGGGAPATLSGANEIAVEAFLAGQVPWLAIAEVNASVLAAGAGNVRDVADVLEADRVARERAREAVARW